MMLLLQVCAAYLIGAIPTGVILTKMTGAEDIRQSGSGNIGATNVYRVAGRTLGVITLIGDCLKGVIPVLIAQRFLHLGTGSVALIAIATFLGHCYPVYLGFKGGKGVATALGIFLVLSPATILCDLIIFILVLWKWRFISLASVSAAAFTPFFVYFFLQSITLFVATLIIAALVIWRHKANIERLLNGNENRFNL
ncbi:MAG: glycerol-3-phosphate acyltransferase [Desulfuromonadales bacterium]|nr:glycerol-3-phosphate acyltransferase [Desulfuromonadales bacterium]MBN2790883.1 glycerol-3-phosphate acyltransferase [Desulfuromonadales bacterium]